MLHEILRFLTINAYVILFFLLAFGSAIGAFITRQVNKRNRRRELEEARKHELRVLEERRRTAEAAGDAIKILLADRELGADFDRRYHAALAAQEKEEKRTGVRVTAGEPEKDELHVEVGGERRARKKA